MRASWATVALLASMSILAGCVDEPGVGLPPASAEEVRAAIYAEVDTLLEGIPCTLDTPLDKRDGLGTSANLVPLSAFQPEVKDRTEIDIHGDLLVAPSRAGALLDLLDISNPLQPSLIASVPLDEATEAVTRVLDVKFLSDGTGIILADSSHIALFDARDPTNLTLEHEYQWVDDYPGISEAHMFSTAHIADQEWLFIGASSGFGVKLFRIDGEPGQRTLVPDMNYNPVETSGASPLFGGPIGPHDAWVTYDDVLGTHLLYVANGFEGWLLYDVADPTAPTLLAQVPSLDPFVSYTHTVRGVYLEDGRRIVATISEVGENVMRIYDATNLDTVRLVGIWARDPTDLAAPQHNINVVGTQLFLAHDAHGMYVFDLEETPTGIPPQLNFDVLQPTAHLGGKGPATEDYLARGDVWDVLVKDGIIYTSHVEAGEVRATASGCLEPGNDALSSHE